MTKVPSETKSSPEIPCKVDVLEIRIAGDMIRRIETARILERIQNLRSTLQEEQRIDLPLVRIRDDFSMNSGSISFLVHGVETANLWVGGIDFGRIAIETLRSIALKHLRKEELT